MYLVLFVLGMSLLKGGKGKISLIGVPPCGMLYWSFNFLVLAGCIFFLKKFTEDIKDYEEQKEKYGYNFTKYGDKFTIEKSNYFLYISLLNLFLIYYKNFSFSF
jgi:hypothetical protein